jgi:ribose transport system substrate-binding protein
LADVPLELPSGNVPMSQLSGKSVWLINELPIQELSDIADGFKAAATAAGLKATIINTKGTAASWLQGVSQAVGQNAAGIVLLGVPWQLVSAPLQQAQTKHIPVVQFSDGGPSDTPPATVFSHITSDFSLGGKLMADWVLSDSSCKATVGYIGVGTGAGSSGSELDKGFSDELKSLCAGCKLTTATANVATLATQLPGETQSLMRRDPNINYMVATFDSLVTYVAPAATQVKPNIKIVAHDGADASLQLISSGQAQVADVALPPPGYQGWLLMDALARGMTGQQPADIVIPQRLVDKTNIQTSIEALFPQYSSYKDGFLKLWGLS